MKYKAILFVLALAFCSSCKTPEYLPASNQIDINPYGSYITVNLKGNAPYLKGELIAIDSSRMVVLTEAGKTSVIPVAEVERFKVLYAKPKHYGGFIGFVVLLPFMHGFYSAITIPLHLIVTTSVTIAGENAFTYNQKNMTYDKLKMFSRFPLGIPAHVNVQELQLQEPEIKKKN